MKWFFAVTEDIIFSDYEHGVADSIRAAVKSARDHTRLIPHMIFDGQECDFTREMRELGVTVLFHRLHYYERLDKARQKYLPEASDYMKRAADSLLRLEIPLLEREEKHILYTDCDILFLRDPQLEFCKAEIFAACGQADPQGYYSDMNAGVLVMNLERLRNDLPAIVDFLCDNLYHINGYGQEVLRLFYNGQWSPLSARFNWKPYWGVNDEAVIVHFHAVKPLNAQRLLEELSYQEDDPSSQSWRSCFFLNPSAYAHYVSVWEGFVSLSAYASLHLIEMFDAQRKEE